MRIKDFGEWVCPRTSLESDRSTMAGGLAQGVAEDVGSQLDGG
jgi:hypothetical protein